MYFLFKKFFILATSLLVSIFSTNEFYVHASVFKNISKEIINSSNDITRINITFTSAADNIVNDISNHNKKIKKSKKVDISSNNYENSNSTYKAIYEMEATAYTGDTVTATGTTPVRNPGGISTIAVDPSIIPLGSKVYIPEYGVAIATDTGGAIKGYRIDLFLNSETECVNWGRQNVTVYVLEYPDQ